MLKTKNLPLKSVKRKTRVGKSASSRTSQLIATRTPLKHLRLIKHTHTGKVLPKRHTSHLALVILLLIVGIFIFAMQGLAHAAQQTMSHTQTISATVVGEAPTIGATILIPLTDTTTTESVIQVSGTCSNETFVVMYNNGLTAGTTTCSVAGVFAIAIQLSEGDNALQALNYDSLNQAGPDTPTVTVTSHQPAPVDAVTGETLPATSVDAHPELPSSLVNPIIVPSDNPSGQNCDTFDDSKIEKTADFRISVVCFYRNLNTFSQYQLGLYIQSGTPPYAVSIDWGTNKVPNKLISLKTAGYHVISFAYPIPGLFTIKIHTNDFNGLSAYTQTIAEVNGTSPTSIFTTVKNDVLHTSWFETPVPIYLIVLTLTVGFWVGDLFDRKYGVKKGKHRRVS